MRCTADVHLLLQLIVALRLGKKYAESLKGSAAEKVSRMDVEGEYEVIEA